MSLCSCAPGWHGAPYQRSGNKKNEVSGNTEIERDENVLRKWFHQQWLISSLNACLLPEGGTDSVGEAGSVQNHSLPEPGWLRFMSKQEARSDGRMHPTLGRYRVTVNIHVVHTVGTDSWHCYHHHYYYYHALFRSLSPTSFSLLLGKCQAPHKMGLSGTHFQSVEKVIARLFCCPCLIPPVNASLIPNVVGLHHPQGQSFVSLPLRSTGRYGLLGNLLSLNVSPWKQVAKTISFYNIDE